MGADFFRWRIVVGARSWGGGRSGRRWGQGCPYKEERRESEQFMRHIPKMIYDWTALPTIQPHTSQSFRKSLCVGKPTFGKIAGMESFFASSERRRHRRRQNRGQEGDDNNMIPRTTRTCNPSSSKKGCAVVERSRHTKP